MRNNSLRNLAEARERSSGLARDIVRDIELFLTRIDLAAGPGTLDWARASYLDRAVGRASTQEIDLDLARARARVGELRRAIAPLMGPGSARALDRDLANDLDNALVGELRQSSAAIRDLAATLEVWELQPAGQVAPLAGHLLASAARMLPARDRLRYSQEFWSELMEIAQAKVSHRVQLAYAYRQMWSAWQLRSELRLLQRRKTVQLEITQARGRHRTQRAYSDRQMRSPWQLGSRLRLPRRRQAVR